MFNKYLLNESSKQHVSIQADLSLTNNIWRSRISKYFTYVSNPCLFGLYIQYKQSREWKETMSKNAQTLLQLHSFHMLERLCSKSFKLSFSNTWTKNFQMCKPDLEKAGKPEIKFPTSVGSEKKQGNYQKSSNSALLTTLKPLNVWVTTNCGKFLKRWEYQTTLLVSWETCMQDENHQNMEQWTGSKLGNEYVKVVTLLI